jgi:L,D-peptidoglycan transpeptidase YkuD (ErfK/YbiS/YcfS/YnhG family)
MLVLSGCSTIAPKTLQGLDRSIGQAVVVHPIQHNASQAELSLWQKQDYGWHRLLRVSAVIGRNGLAPFGAKKEGDGKTPSGVFPLETAFGYAPAIMTGLEYRQAGNLDFWVDDPGSVQYNQWVRGAPVARSFERMKRSDNLYQYGIIIGYNRHPVMPGAGSAIFMHVWRKYDHPTSGCVAVSQRYLRKILRWLDKQYQPVIILE